MGSLADRLDGIHLRVRVPGTEIEAELRDRKNVTISFGESVYEFLNERSLEQYMASLARLLYVGWIRAYRDAISGTSIVVDEEPADQAERDFLEARSEMESIGASSDRRVTMSAVGMQDVNVRIAPGTLRELNEHQFATRVNEAVFALADDHLGKIRELKVRFFA